MSSIINNSNANSALVNTLESSDSMMNPNVYSTKEVYPTSATVWTKNQSSNGGTGDSQQLNFNLNKYGIIEQILLEYTKIASNETDIITEGDIFNVVERVELLSGSRTTSILTGADLMAQFSNLTSSELGVINRTAIKSRGGSTTLNTTRHTYVLPLTFGFMEDINTQLNASFLEPLSIRVTWGVNTKYVTGTDATSTGIESGSCTLQVRYKSYPEQPTAQILASNYNQPELVQVSTRFYDENPQTFTYTDINPTTGGALGFGGRSETINLRNTDCVEAFYVMVRRIEGSGATLHYGPCEQITNLAFRGSGQDILNLTEGNLAYGALQENGFSTMGATANEVATSAVRLMDIGKIQVGLFENGGGGPLSNTLSLREINAPQITVSFNTPKDLPTEGDPYRYRVDIVENCTAIYSTSSAVGRLTLALSN